MKYVTIGQTDMVVSSLAYGCMHLGARWDRRPLYEQEIQAAKNSVFTAVDEGINFFDHADIYCFGKSEEAFSAVLKERASLREQVYIQSKCAIRFQDDPFPGAPKRYDYGVPHIVGSVDGILQRLGTDYIDVLLLHRPDPLMEADEMARAFDLLHRSGKVRYFGVSNHSVMQMELLQKWVVHPLIINQLELSLGHCDLLNDSILVNQNTSNSAHGDGLIEYCRLKDIFMQAWSPLASGRFFSDPQDEPCRRTAQAIKKMAEKRGTSMEVIMLAWIMRHPANIQPVIGSRNPDRIRACCRADEMQLTREEWYELFSAARGGVVP
ncbi:MAG: aldo/keto reductase [Spartobacteria bacterium]|nr:aldo/keto reductase [Spartobacteria bacterium]